MKVAVVGSGVSGLAATWLLNEYSDHEVHLYESDYRPGGHANTVQFHPQDYNEAISVDTGFIVLNPTTYPNFLRFLKLYPKAIKILPTEMTFSVSRDNGEFEWAGKNLLTIFCQGWRRVLDPGMWRMLYDVLRFNVCAGTLLPHAPRSEKDGTEEISIGDYLKRERYSDVFRDNYLLPMAAAIWSTPPDKCALDFPARTLIQFMHNHHLLQILGKPSWLTLQGGSHTYVNQILSNLPDSHLHLSTPVVAVSSVSDYEESFPTTPVSVSTHDLDQTEPEQVRFRRLSATSSSSHEGSIRVNGIRQSGPRLTPPPSYDQSSSARKIKLRTAIGDETVYDHIILACHSDAALRILQEGGALGTEKGVTEEEQEILGMFSWNRNEAVLHTDTSLMPKCRSAWSCWNYITKSVVDNEKVKANVDQVSLTYGMNDLQHIPESKYGPVLVTLNPPPDKQPAEDLVIGKWRYDHPILDTKAIRAQNMMSRIQGKRSISFAGAYLRYGFHEDGFTSGIRAALSIEPIPGSKHGNEKSMPSIRPPFEFVVAQSDPRRKWDLSGLVGWFLEVMFVWFEGSWCKKIAFEIVGYWTLVVLACILGVDVQ